VSLYVVRHAKAGSRSAWDDDDMLRPLSKAGQKQADGIADRLHGEIDAGQDERPRLVSSPFVRCMETLVPLGARLGLAVEPDDRLAEGWTFEPALQLLDEVPDGSVLCTHGDVLPDLIAALERRGLDIDGDPDWRKGAIWQLERNGDGAYVSGTPIPPPEGRMTMDESAAVNKAIWDERAPAHAASPDYDVRRLVDDPDYLSDVVTFDLPRLGDIAGLRCVHLQCHIGTDTVSLARLGATVTGLDFSAASLAEARRLCAAAGTAVEFVESNVYDAVDALGAERFDLVYTGVGALNWLPDVRRWAGVVAGLLVPGGRLFIREGHPMLWALDDERGDGTLAVEYPYFETADPGVFETAETYVRTDHVFEHTTTHEWNHGIGEIVTAVLDAGMELTGLVEHDRVSWDALPGLMTDVGGGEFRLTDRPQRLPHTYTLQARKR
jgi:phosphohistidine phosphatase SixA/SAM-dependent methyltransferase